MQAPDLTNENQVHSIKVECANNEHAAEVKSWLWAMVSDEQRRQIQAVSNAEMDDELADSFEIPGMPRAPKPGTISHLEPTEEESKQGKQAKSATKQSRSGTEVPAVVFVDPPVHA